MRCRRASRLWVERGLADLPSETAAALETHLAGCPRCATRAAVDAGISAALRDLGRDPAPEIDVRETVARRVLALPAPQRGELSPAALGSAAAAAVAFAVLLAGGAWQLSPALFGLAAKLVSLFAVLRPLAAATATSIMTLASSAGRTLIRLLAAAGAAAHTLEPVWTAALVLAAALMAATVAVAVARDFRSVAPAREE